MPVTRRYENDQEAAANFQAALMDLPEEWVICRDVRHAWDVQQDFHVTHRQGRKVLQIGRVLICMRCKTLRVETYVHTADGLDKTGQGYRYPEHYQIKGVPRGVKPQWIIHEEQYRRAMEKIAAIGQASETRTNSETRTKKGRKSA